MYVIHSGYNPDHKILYMLSSVAFTMTYARMEKDTLNAVREYGKQHEREIREYFKTVGDARVGIDRIVRFMIHRFVVLGEMEIEGF